VAEQPLVARAGGEEAHARVHVVAVPAEALDGEVAPEGVVRPRGAVPVREHAALAADPEVVAALGPEGLELQARGPRLVE
jgi:hypothetical protein